MTSDLYNACKYNWHEDCFYQRAFLSQAMLHCCTIYYNHTLRLWELAIKVLWSNIVRGSTLSGSSSREGVCLLHTFLHKLDLRTLWGERKNFTLIDLGDNWFSSADVGPLHLPWHKHLLLVFPLNVSSRWWGRRSKLDDGVRVLRRCPPKIREQGSAAVQGLPLESFLTLSMNQ